MFEPRAPESRLLTIEEISGILDHSSACNELQQMDRDPPIGLHPDLRAYALGLLRDNIPITQLQQLCKKWAAKRWGATSMGDNVHRHQLNEHDASSLYRTISGERGIPQRTAAEDNLDTWFRPVDPSPPDAALTSSMLYYHPCSNDDDRLVLIIATPEMQDAAWKYGHEGHILLDLTFGFCSARANLLILMAIDDNYKGVPIGFIIFTARPNAKAVHADYNTDLIRSLLEKWRKGLGKNKDGSEFDFHVATTDNDSRERTALQDIWSKILLLLCMFHVWQAWRNGLNKHLRVIPKGDKRVHTRRHLAKFLMRLLKEITQYPEAIAAYNAELEYFKALCGKSDPTSKAQGKGGLAFLNYLGSYLRVRSFWLAWSKAGVIEAATRLGVPIDRVPRTNNHLESFNGKIKNKYFEAYKHTGRLPRLDLWVLLIITKVMPDYFQQLKDRQSQRQYYAAMRKAPSCIRGTSSTKLPDLDQGSLLSPDSSTASIEDTAEEHEMIDEMVDGDAHSDSEGDSDHDREEAIEPCDFRDFGAQPLQIDLDGEACRIIDAVLGGEEAIEGSVVDLGFVEGGDTTSEDYGDDSMLWDNAVGSENILDGLRSLELDPANKSPIPSAGSVVAPLAPLDINRDLPSARKPTSPEAGSVSLANAQATTMQEMLVIQDELGQVLRKLKMLKIDKATLEPYTPVYLRPRLFGDTAAVEPLAAGPSSQAELEPRYPMSNLTRTCKKMILDHLEDEDLELSGSESDKRRVGPELPRLLPLQRQTKERRKESHGIR